MKKLISGVLVA